MVIKYDPTPLVLNYNERIKTELKSGSPTTAFLLLCGYLEGFLKEFLLISELEDREELNNKVLKSVERLSFANMVLFLLIANRIDLRLYKNMLNFNEYRNKVVHRLHTVNIEDKRWDKELKGKIKEGLKICNKIEKLFNETLDEKAEKI